MIVYYILHLSALLFLDDEVRLETEEINFGFKVWENFQDSIVGFKTSVQIHISIKKTVYEPTISGL